jgi:beta-1,4-N-acetylglucosaminyltransferase
MKIYFICSAGGHLTELIYSVGEDIIKLKPTLLSYEDMKIDNVKFKKLINPHRSFFKYIYCSFQTLKYFIQDRPEAVISTGAGIAIPGIILGKLIFRSKIIFIESLAYINKPTWTGRLIYFFADLFIIQNEELLSIYPKAKIGRII